jgi:hypothetical protein
MTHLHEAKWLSRALCALLIAIVLTLGCAASTELMSTWSEPAYSEGTVDNVLVVALRDDPVKRRRWEDGFVSALGARGVKATPSYTLFPSSLPDTQQVVTAVQERGFGGVMSLMRLADQTRTVTSPGGVQREAVTAQDWQGRFHTYYRDVYVPGSSNTEELLNFQSDLWTTPGGTGRLVWSAIVRVNESISGDYIHDAVRSGFMPRLVASGMVPKKAVKR